jgi:phosphohistidine phosphatase
MDDGRTEGTMQLYLVQHGPALSEDQDPTRPLSKVGLHLAKRSAAHAARLGVRVSEIRHSDKLRAAQTAREFEAALAAPRRETEGLHPNDDVSRLRRDVQSLDDNLLIVGHLPFLVRLAAALLCQDESMPVVAFQQAGIVRLDRDEGGRWSLMWAIPPDIMPED